MEQSKIIDTTETYQMAGKPSSPTQVFIGVEKNRVGDDGVPAVLQYRPSGLYLTDRKETMAIFKIPTPLSIFAN